jgi:hypothetical protein
MHPTPEEPHSAKMAVADAAALMRVTDVLEQR